MSSGGESVVTIGGSRSEKRDPESFMASGDRGRPITSPSEKGGKGSKGGWRGDLPQIWPIVAGKAGTIGKRDGKGALA